MNYYLMIHNHPPLIVYDEDKRLYYECLQKYDETEDLNSLCEFFKYETKKHGGRRWLLPKAGSRNAKAC